MSGYCISSTRYFIFQGETGYLEKNPENLKKLVSLKIEKKKIITIYYN